MTKDEAQHSRWTFYQAVNSWEGSENPFGILLAHRDQCYFSVHPEFAWKVIF